MSRSKISEKRSARGRGGAVSGRCALRWRRLRDPASLEQSVQAPGRSHESDCIVWWSAVHSRNRAGGLWRPRAAASPRLRGLGAQGQRVLSAGCVQGPAATRARKLFYPRIRHRGRAEIAAAEPIWLRAARGGASPGSRVWGGAGQMGTAERARELITKRIECTAGSRESEEVSTSSHASRRPPPFLPGGAIFHAS
jgi:hypothetical protein